MSARDYRDIVGGAGLFALGAFAAIHTASYLRIGTLTRMGPGMFPFALGVILLVLGLAILIPALLRRGAMPQVDVRPMITVLLSMLVFAVLVRPFGMVPAIVALTVISSRADNKLSPAGIAAVAGSLSVASVLIFRVGLGVPLPIFAWPW